MWHLLGIVCLSVFLRRHIKLSKINILDVGILGVIRIKNAQRRKIVVQLIFLSYIILYIVFRERRRGREEHLKIPFQRWLT